MHAARWHQETPSAVFAPVLILAGIGCDDMVTDLQLDVLNIVRNFGKIRSASPACRPINLKSASKSWSSNLTSSSSSLSSNSSSRLASLLKAGRYQLHGVVLTVPVVPRGLCPTGRTLLKSRTSCRHRSTATHVRRASRCEQGQQINTQSDRW